MVQAAARTRRPQPTPLTDAKQSPKRSQLSASLLSLKSPSVQPKLTVNTPGDKYEQEADAVASAVMHIPAPLPQPDTNRGSIQRMAEDDQDVLQRLPSDEESVQRMAPQAEAVQRKGEGSPRVSPSTAATIRNPGSGTPLSSGVRHRVEPHVGANLSGVRVHTGPSAHHAAANLNARAFTHGNHIFLNRSESSHNLGLMAHESTHVVQQGAAPIQRQPLDEESPPIQRQSISEAENTIQRISFTEVLDYAEEVIDIPAGLMQLAQDIDNAGGIFAYLESLVSGVVDAIFGGLERGADTISNLIQNFNQLFSSTAALGAAIANGDRPAFTEAVINLTDALREIAGDAWSALDTLLGPVRDFLDGVLDTLDAPLENWIEQIAGGIWTTIVAIGRNLWNWTADIRNSSLANWAWEDIREELGISGPDTFDTLLSWVKGKAAEAWNAIKAEFSGVINAIRETTQTIRDVIAAENIYALRDLVDAWLVNARDFVLALNADDGNGVASQQDLLRDVLIPAIQAGAASLRESIIQAGSWIAGLIGDLATKVTGFIGSLRSIPILSAIPELFDWVNTAVTDLSTWAQETVIGLFTQVGDGIVYLTDFIEPVLNTLINMVSATSDLLNNLPDLISAAWNAIPAWIRDPIKDFILNQVLGRIPIFGELVRNPEVWARAQETAMRILQQIFVSGDLRGAAWSFFQALLELLQFPTELVTQIIDKTVSVFNSIIENPGGFFMNLLGAIKQGFSNFFGNFLNHLMNGVQGWILGQAAEAGIQPPQDFSLGSIFQFVLDVLGINTDLLWERLTVKLGAERVAQIRQALDVISGAWEWISIAINEGPGALWERLQERLGELWDQVMNGIIDWINQTIIEQVTVRLLSMLDPTGIMAVVNSVIALYNTIQSFIEYFTPILEMINKVLDGIQGIVSGAIDVAAQFLEMAMASSLRIALGFLANYAGLGRLGEKLQEMIQMVRGYIIQAIDWLIDQALRIGGAILSSLGLGSSEGTEANEDTPESQAVKAAALQEVRSQISRNQITSLEGLAEILDEVQAAYQQQGLRSLTAQVNNSETMSIAIEAIASPSDDATLRWEEIFSPEELEQDDVQSLRPIFETPNIIRRGAETSAIVTVNGNIIHERRTSERQGHAEEVLIQNGFLFIAANRAVEIARSNLGAPVRVVLAINRSPCHSICTPQLIRELLRIKSDIPAVRMHDINFILTASTAYLGGEIPEEQTTTFYLPELINAMPSLPEALEVVDLNRIWQGSPREDIPNEPTRSEDLAALQAAGWDLRVLNVGDQQTESAQFLEARIRMVKRLLLDPFSTRFNEVMGRRSPFRRNS